ncbi:hypothetical protein SDRG_08342 [Saprolegnia diclina VS20]|uniref:CCAAT-binding factor domain-containing protein n=1 Tax=Saprolegnia diclina (strain VS20) TaxID=1156394 RepID=T0RNZ5_SAPDV|nr:hypothetical protein SDRG_08342 [Saprolegnia diclina VS20]EQC34133.1 hypothetical protein SDRG_08342 [Saprolegnia diclina VS20]|eukprot:XP_008612445.1 hypothetical protein SDRG_08342 [Saprolegnia diclina VS20]
MGNNKKGPKKAAGGAKPAPATAKPVHAKKQDAPKGKPQQKPAQPKGQPQQKPAQPKVQLQQKSAQPKGKPQQQQAQPKTQQKTHEKKGAATPNAKQGKPTTPVAKSGKKGHIVVEAEDTQPNEKLALMLKNMKDNAVAWHLAVKPLSASKATNDAPKYKPNDPIVEEKRKLAESAMEKQLKALESKGSLSSDDKYLKTMMKSGTLADRIAATTLAIQGSPIHNLQRLSQLVTMAKNKSRRESQMAVDSLKDLFLNNLLPDRKLHFFHQQPLHRPDATLQHLVIWYFEHCIKMAFSQLIAVLSNGMNDAIDVHKRACIRAVVALLTEKPEQEAVLLSMLVNKLGDPERKIAAYVLHQLQELLKTHPVMKRVVVSDVERLLTRTKVTERTKYNAVLFLNQLYLDAKDKTLATHLIKVYFGLFTKEVHRTGSEAGGLERKLLSALLVGVNRSFPYAECTSADFQSEIDTMFRVVHTAHFSTSVQALMLLFQVMNSTTSVPDRFYTALYAKLLDPKLPTTSKHTMFLNVLFRAMKSDVSPARVNAMIKRLLQVAYTMAPAFACASLYLVSQVMAHNPRLRGMIDMAEASDVSVVATDATAVTKATNDDDDEDEETASDDNATENVPEEDDADLAAERDRSAALLAAMGLDGADAVAERQTTSQAGVATVYDAKKRNPLYAGADNACLWELQPFLQHYHPSVATFAKQLLEGQIVYSGDPLTDFTLTTFFDKFVNKKPKAKDGPHQRGVAAPSAMASMYSEEFQNQDEGNVEESDKFFYTFFKERLKRKPKKAKKEPKDGDASEDDEYEAFATQLAEGLMQDNDDEDVDMDDWSGPEDSEDDEDAEDADPSELLANEFPDSDSDASEVDDEELLMTNGHSLADDADDFMDDDDDEDDDEDDDMDDDEDDEDDEDDMVFQEDKTAKFAAKSKKGAAPDRKRKSPFASADDYLDQIAELEATARSSKSKKPRK